MDYIPHNIRETKSMLDSLGLEKLEELFKHIPEEIRLEDGLDLDDGLDEWELSCLNNNLLGLIKKPRLFMGGGRYHHHIPSIVSMVSSRPEFYTAYTPFQSEASQGVLEVLFDFQSKMTALTGKDVSNAGLYDGSTALAEASRMACRKTRRNVILYPDSLNPYVADVLETYARYTGFNTKIIKTENGTLNEKSLKKNIDESVAALILQNPNFFGLIEECEVKDSLDEMGCLLISYVAHATSLGFLKPMESADIICGDAQSLGNPMGFGGTSIGFFTCSKEYIRLMPGRIVGETKDAEGKKGYVLTYQTREQHIRREKATSNICTAESLNALNTCVYLDSLGFKGLREVSRKCNENAVYLRKELLKTDDYEEVFTGRFFNEFVLKTEKTDFGIDISKRYSDLENCRLFSLTELDTIESIDSALEAVI